MPNKQQMPITKAMRILDTTLHDGSCLGEALFSN